MLEAWLWLIAVVLVLILTFIIIAIATNSQRCKNEERKFTVSLSGYDESISIDKISGNDSPVLIVDKDGIKLHYNLIIKGLKCKEDLKIYLIDENEIMLKELTYIVSPRGTIQAQGIWTDKDVDLPLEQKYLPLFRKEKIFILIKNKEYPNGLLKGCYVNTKE